MSAQTADMTRREVFLSSVAVGYDGSRWRLLTTTQADMLNETRCLTYDLAVSAYFAGPRPSWVWPVWLTGMAYA